MAEWSVPHDWADDEEVTEALADANFKDNPQHLKDLINVSKVNADAVSHPQGTVVRLNATSGQIARSTAAGQTGPVGVAVASSVIVSGASGYYSFTGMVSALCTGAIAVGDQLQTSGAAGYAAAGGTNPFGIAHGTQASGGGLVLIELINPIGSVSLATHDHTGSGDGGVLTNDEHDGYSRYDEIAVPSAPAASTARLYAYDKSGTTEMAYKNESGTVRDLSLAGQAVDHSHTAVGDGGVLDSPRFTDDLRTSANAIIAQIVGTAGLAIGSAANATTDTSPYLYITTSAGPPTGVPTAATGRVAVHYDSTNKRVYLYDTGTAAWIYVPIGTQAANLVLAGPTSGGAAQAVYRALVTADLGTIVAGTNFATQTANTALRGPGSGSAATPTFRADVVADLPTLPKARIYHSASQSLTDGAVQALDMNSERTDSDTMHFTSSAALTGTVSKNGTTTLTGVSTLFLSELSIGQVISVPGTSTEKRVVTAIATDTSLTVSTAFANTASGQTATRVNSALVARTAGYYDSACGVAFDANATGTRLVAIKLNATTLIAINLQLVVSAANQCVITVANGYQLAQWDFLEVYAQQTSGGALNAAVSTDYSPWLSATWQSP